MLPILVRSGSRPIDRPVPSSVLDPVPRYGPYPGRMTVGTEDTAEPGMDDATTVLTIGQLAEAAGVGIETVRFYERRGLLAEPPRTPAGYRQYSGDDVERLRLIARAKELGFTLAEIADLLDRAGSADVTAIRAAAETKLSEIDEEQARLATTRARLGQLVTVCADGDEDDCLTLNLCR